MSKTQPLVLQDTWSRWEVAKCPNVDAVPAWVSTLWRSLIIDHWSFVTCVIALRPPGIMTVEKNPPSKHMGVCVCVCVHLCMCVSVETTAVLQNVCMCTLLSTTSVWVCVPVCCFLLNSAALRSSALLIPGACQSVCVLFQCILLCVFLLLWTNYISVASRPPSQGKNRIYIDSEVTPLAATDDWKHTHARVRARTHTLSVSPVAVHCCW